MRPFLLPFLSLGASLTNAELPRPPAEIPIASFPRFHHIHLLSGCLTHTLSPSFIREFALHAPDPLTSRPIHVGHLLRADEAVWHSRFSDGVKVELTGTLTTHFVLVAPVVSPGGGGMGEGGGGAAAAQQAHGPPNLRIESMDFDARGHEEFVQREAIISERVERVYDLPGFAGLGNLESDTMVEGGSEGSPTSAGGGKKGGSGAASFSGALTRRRSAVAEEGAGGGKEDPLRGHTLPKSGGGWQKERLGGLGSIEASKEFKAPSKVGSFGITEMGMRCLEVSLAPFFAFAVACLGADFFCPWLWTRLRLRNP